MPTLTNKYTLTELSNKESPSEILLNTKENTQLHIISSTNRTLIKLPYGSKFDIVDGIIIIHEKYTPESKTLESKSFKNNRIDGALSILEGKNKNVESICFHNYADIDNFSDRLKCTKCGKHS